MPRNIKFGRFGTWWAGPIPAGFHRMTFPKDSGPDEITFRLSNKRYEFDKDDPIWVQKDTGSCPPGDGVHKDFRVTKCDDNELKVENLNEDELTLRYQLNVVDTRTSQRVPIDPIMKNGGRT